MGVDVLVEKDCREEIQRMLPVLLYDAIARNGIDLVNWTELHRRLKIDRQFVVGVLLAAIPTE